MTFVKAQLMLWSTNKITDHNRGEVGIDVERIEKKQRLANGTLRKFFIADKRTFQTQWTMVPKLTTQTVDGFYGADDMESFYNSTPGAFTLTLTDGDGETNSYSVMFSNFSRTIVKRGNTDFWNVNVTMEEV